MAGSTQSFWAITLRPISRAASNWLRPRSTDRDVAFRERVIRSTLGITIILALLSLSLNVLVFKGEFTLISYYTMHFVALAGCFASAILVSRGHVVSAGWLLVLTFLFGANSVVLLARQSSSITGFMNATVGFMFVPVIATLVLPRNLIFPISLLAVATYAFSGFVYSMNGTELAGISANQQIPSIFVAISIAGILLRQLRIEFDDRFEAMRESAQQMEQAIHEAETARHLAERDRQRAEDADKAKTRFMANMSHELRTPLNAIIGYNEIMLGGMVGAFTPKQTDLLRRMQQNGRRLLSLINDVLDLSKIESSSVEIYLAPMSPHKMITQTVESLRSLAQAKQIALNIELADTLPSVVLGDANKIQQILVNLVSNAIKFTDQGSVTVTAQGNGQSQWQFSVTDTGIGMPQDAVSYIFLPFKQVDSSDTRKQKGTGLGLSISHRLSEMMQGTMSVQTELGHGSNFTITLPRVNVPEAQVAEPKAD